MMAGVVVNAGFTKTVGTGRQGLGMMQETVTEGTHQGLGHCGHTGAHGIRQGRRCQFGSMPTSRSRIRIIRMTEFIQP